MQDRYQQAHQQQNKKHDPQNHQDRHSNSTDHLGEYVDYEEID